MFDQTEYEGVDFSEAEILEEQLSHLTFRDCRFHGADFAAIVLEGCRFENCDFSSASLNGITARRCAFLNCSFRFADCFADHKLHRHAAPFRGLVLHLSGGNGF